MDGLLAVLRSSWRAMASFTAASDAAAAPARSLAWVSTEDLRCCLRDLRRVGLEALFWSCRAMAAFTTSSASSAALSRSRFWIAAESAASGSGSPSSTDLGGGKSCEALRSSCRRRAISMTSLASEEAFSCSRRWASTDDRVPSWSGPVRMKVSAWLLLFSCRAMASFITESDIADASARSWFWVSMEAVRYASSVAGLSGRLSEALSLSWRLMAAFIRSSGITSASSRSLL
mmetsp:Transcript_11193/g.31746  ORF Transcript_11193/g.31746 Transcript_11193/m.31746 type:complete len:232 (+) Transcript_11193:95-790(+)